MFNKVLIANRGAIAARIIRTLNELNVASVAIYAQSDAQSLHVRQASESYCLGDGPAADTYLDIDKIIAIAKESGAQAIHPGYGFLSENPRFVERCESEGIAFIGPTPEQIQVFGLKHKARELAQKANVPLLSGSELLPSLDEALRVAENIAYPIMLKSTAGGGGIGMQVCVDPEELEQAYDSVKRLGANNFADDGVFIEKFIARARHIEVQVFGDGQGNALAIGERDCSSQRRNQKVVEECPAPNLPEELAAELHQTAEALLSQVSYRNAGTVEFLVDADTHKFYFLEVNTRLQVEHGVTEEVFDIDLVEWMLKLSSGKDIDLANKRKNLKAHGHAIQVRLYAEDPYRDFQPCPGLLSKVSFPDYPHVRIDHWIESGIEVPPYFDPMLAKVIVKGHDRQHALICLRDALDDIRLYGAETNLAYLKGLLRDPVLEGGLVTTRYLNDFTFTPARIDVITGGTQTTIQDLPGRVGYWDVGVPPSGPFDSYSFQLGNRLLDNPDDAAGLEITVQGPELQFQTSTQVVITGAKIESTLDDKPIELNQVLSINAGEVLKLGRITGAGTRAYLCIQGGLNCPAYMGSRSTFTLGQFGGHNGRALRIGDVLHLNQIDRAGDESSSDDNTSLDSSSHEQAPIELLASIENEWELRVIYGPHGSPDFFTREDIDTFFEHTWEVHYNSSRTGVRLIGPKPNWARENGGEAGLHPSNIHDNAYAFGTVDFTGDMPVILGPDGPSLGGFVCPATVIQADLWKLGQLKAGAKVRFKAVSVTAAVELYARQQRCLRSLHFEKEVIEHKPQTTPILKTLSAEEYGVAVTYRVAGDQFLLVEYGEQSLDIALRFRAHALMQFLQDADIEGVLELTPGIRSLQVHYDSQTLSLGVLMLHLQSAEDALKTRLQSLRVPSRSVYLPLSWDDEACRLAIEKYDQTVRENAPWSPSNLEFIRRINGLESIDDVKKIVFDASYLVMGLGDVYLGAPVATPVDPRHRLVTTKYNPARTWTAENSVGIGGSYLCVYGMEGPGGYQFVGRTLQMWNRYRNTEFFEKPWLLRFFDQIRFYEVSHDELMTIREQFPVGTYPIKVEEGSFSLSEYQAFLSENQESIDTFKGKREAAFEAELAEWHRTGQFNFEVAEDDLDLSETSWEEGQIVVDSPVSGSVWQSEITSDSEVVKGQVLMILESMKMEIPVHATSSGVVKQVLLDKGQRVSPGQALVVIEEH
ncbi:MAG: urea carboxylase [Oleiphilaceae bacterium]|nr:urea carboxylase [Oleiphilaceae bacterium]